MEELQARHKQEQRDLQSRITQKKKQASKKTRKGVNEECDRLEADLRARQQAEVAALNGENVDVETPVGQLAALELQDDGEDAGERPNGTAHAQTENATAACHEEPPVPPLVKKPNRQKARLARRAAEQEEQAKKAAQEAQDLPDLKQQERERMLGYMKEHGLQEKEIRADGHCLYSAIADQLDQIHIPLGAGAGEQPVIGYKVVRAAAADYIVEHQDDFAPFLEEPLQNYVHKVRDTGEWGGQLELMALAKSYGTDINVLQDFGRVEKIEGAGTDKQRTMWLGYYKHGFGLGEHYNSLRKAP